MAKFFDHLKKKNHVWISAPALSTVAGYIWYAIATNQSEQQLTTNAVYVLIAAFTVFGGIISVFVMASLDKNDFGEAAEFRTPILLGVSIGMLLSTLKLLGLFGLLHAAAVSAGR